MSEPFEVNDLDQLTDIIVTATLPLADGRSALVKIRPLTPRQLREIRRAITWPKPPIKDYKKVGDEVVQIYDYQDKAYSDAYDDANQEQSNKMLVASLVMHIPGNSVAEQCQALEDKLGSAAYVLLVNAVNKINVPSKEDVENTMRSFRRFGDAGTSGNGREVAYPVGVEKLVEIRTDRDASVSASET